MTTVVIGGGENSIAQDIHITDMYVMSTCAITIKTGALIDLQSVLQELLIYEDIFQTLQVVLKFKTWPEGTKNLF